MNWSGIRGALAAVINPRILRPRLVVPDISHLDWARFKANGVTGIVIDKDNCITKPHCDTLELSLQPSWDTLLRTFGPANVLIVSNSAGTRKDSLLLQAESVSLNLRVPVLVHPTPKPGLECAQNVLHYFLPPPPPPPSLLRSLLPRQRTSGAVIWPTRSPSPKLETRPRILVIGDRLTTDVLLSHRLSSLPHHPISTISILTTKLHAKESLGTTFMRSIERLILRYLRKDPRTEGPWDECVLPLIPSVVEKKRGEGWMTMEQLLSPWSSFEGKRWDPTMKTQELFMGPRGSVEWAEKGVESVERIVERGDQVIKDQRGRWESLTSRFKL